MDMDATRRSGPLALLAALVMALCPFALAEKATETLPVACPELGFITRCEAGTIWRWDSVYGLTLHPGGGEGLPCLMISSGGGAGGDPEGYFTGTLTPWMERCLGEDLLSVSDCAVYSLGEGIELPGAMYTFLDPEGRRQVLFRLFDGRWGSPVCYTLRYYDGEGDDALRALGIAAAGFEPVGEGAPVATAGDGASLSETGEIICFAQGFMASCESARAVRWREGEGLYVYLGEKGQLPYVLVNVAGGETDPTAFFEESATPWMRWCYGDDLLEVIDCGSLTAGGRVMRGVGYRCRIGTEVIYALRLLEDREGASVSYIAKFREAAAGERWTTLEALEALAGSLRLE